jgi:hypothetical protein
MHSIFLPAGLIMENHPSIAAPGPTLLALRAYANFLTVRPAILAGDLNNHVRWDKPGKASKHANTVAACAALGLTSAYHAFNGLAQGAERHPTLYWRDRTRTGPTYHIDYAFVSQAGVGFLRREVVGSYAKWIATGLSDHAPLIVDFFPKFAAVDSGPDRVDVIAASPRVTSKHPLPVRRHNKSGPVRELMTPELRKATAHIDP